MYTTESGFAVLPNGTVSCFLLKKALNWNIQIPLMGNKK